MPMEVGTLLKTLIANPKRLFLIDGSGALLTAFLLGFVLQRFEEHFGMPEKVLVPLSILACVYTIYSIGCFFFAGKHWRRFLRVIAIANLVYCCVTIMLTAVYYPVLTNLGLAYFVGEVIIIGGLVYVELVAIADGGRFKPQ